MSIHHPATKKTWMAGPKRPGGSLVVRESLQTTKFPQLESRRPCQARIIDRIAVGAAAGTGAKFPIGLFIGAKRAVNDHVGIGKCAGYWQF
jgi:hypothetical protein